MTDPTAETARQHLMTTAHRHFLDDDKYAALIDLDSDAFETGEDGTFWNDNWHTDRLNHTIATITGDQP